MLAPESVANSTTGVESVLKHYTISLECSNPTLLPDGFRFADAAKSSYVIGSSDDCDVILRDPSVEPLHCGVILEKGAVLVWDLGAQSGVKLNGNLITQDILKVGDTMTLGNLELRVRFQLRRPTIMPKPVPAPDPNAKPGKAAATTPVPTGPPAAPLEGSAQGRDHLREGGQADQAVGQGHAFPRKIRFFVWCKEKITILGLVPRSTPFSRDAYPPDRRQLVHPQPAAHPD